MNQNQVFEQSILINTSLTIVEKCITDQTLMHQWLNPMLKCEAVGKWSTEIGSKCRFLIKIPFINPCLNSTVIERKTGLIVWQFTGFFNGCDRWELISKNDQNNQTLLINRFEFIIPNKIVKFGFNLFASKLTQKDMKDQLKRLKILAEKC